MCLHSTFANEGASTKFHWLWRGASDAVHEEEAEGDVGPGRLLRHGDSGAVSYGSVADVLMKETAEGAKALKAYLEADIRDGEAAGGQKLFGPFNAPARQVLMGRLVESLAEEPY
jgi:hypothetical protein